MLTILLSSLIILCFSIYLELFYEIVKKIRMNSTSSENDRMPIDKTKCNKMHSSEKRSHIRIAYIFSLFSKQLIAIVALNFINGFFFCLHLYRILNKSKPQRSLFQRNSLFVPAVRLVYKWIWKCNSKRCTFSIYSIFSLNDFFFIIEWKKCVCVPFFNCCAIAKQPNSL